MAGGYKRQIDLAKAIGVNLVTYNQHENGKRPLTREAAVVYAKFFGVSVAWLLYGESARAQPLVLVVGQLSRDGWVNPEKYIRTSKVFRKSSDQGYAMDLYARTDQPGTYRRPKFVPAPPGVTRDMAEGMAALEVMTDVFEPLYFQGDILFYVPLKLNAALDYGAVHNRRCVILTTEDKLTSGLVRITHDYKVTVARCGPFQEMDFGHPKAVWPITHITAKANDFI